ncbi:MAG: hypothetical protein GX491_09645 [Chloroflexi bacterium]|nr:hypothetical protein [Chloroflexota bacterium]
MHARKQTLFSAWGKLFIGVLSFLFIAGLTFVLLLLVQSMGGFPPALPQAPATITAFVPTIVITETSLPIVTETPEDTPTPTETPITPTPVPELPAPEASPTAEPTPTPLLGLQSGSARYIQAFNHLDLGCNWVGVAGQVFDANGAGMPDVLITVSGKLEGRQTEWMALTNSDSPYGPGGYEVMLANRMYNPPPPLTIQAFNLQGLPISEPYQFAFPGACEANLLLVTFQMLPDLEE